MEMKPSLIPFDDESDKSEIPSMVGFGAFKRIGVVASILALSGLGLVWESPLRKLQRDSVASLRNDSQNDLLLLAENGDKVKEGLKAAVTHTGETARNLYNKIQDVNEQGRKAEAEIGQWARLEGTKNNKDIEKYVKQMAYAAVILSHIEIDFKAWCHIQNILFGSELMRLERILGKHREKDGPISLDLDVKIIGKAVARGLKDLNRMMRRVTKVQVQFKTLSAVAVQMLREVEEQKKKLSQKASNAKRDIHRAGIGCAVSMVAGAVGTVATVGAGGIFAAGLIALGCGPAAYLQHGNIEDLSEALVKKFEKQAKQLVHLKDTSNALGAQATKDYNAMADVKETLSALDGLLIDDVTLFKEEVVPKMKTLVKKLKFYAETQHITSSEDLRRR
jgi:hypothetical protein